MRNDLDVYLPIKVVSQQQPRLVAVLRCEGQTLVREVVREEELEFGLENFNAQNSVISEESKKKRLTEEYDDVDYDEDEERRKFDDSENDDFKIESYTPLQEE